MSQGGGTEQRMRTPGRHTRAWGLAARRPDAGDGIGHRERRTSRAFQPARKLVAPSTSVMSIMTLLVFVIVMASPAGTAADSAAPVMRLSVPLNAVSFDGVPAVGALFVAGTAAGSRPLLHGERRAQPEAEHGDYGRALPRELRGEPWAGHFRARLSRRRGAVRGMDHGPRHRRQLVGFGRQSR